ncbi:MAG: toxic anion resistance protein [Bacillota bacterium]|nr:toxic anion resistance protein [Bacillota bacterium]
MSFDTAINEVNLDKEVTSKVNAVVQTAKNSPELIKLSQEVDISNPQSIMSFGQETAVEISQFSDRILSSISNSSVEDSGKMLSQLNYIMKKFDAKDFAEDEPKKGLFGKLFNKASEGIEKLLHKYQTIDGEISKVYIQIKEYENEIEKTNKMLDELFDQNLNYYGNLETYIQAGNLAVDNVKQKIIPELEKKTASGEQIDILNLQNTAQSLELLENRIHDLELAKMVSLQTIPQIKLIQNGNNNLLRKTGSAFVVTIPVFKSGLIQAITIKRQKIQSDAMKALDDTTNEMLLRNAQNIAGQSADIAKLMSGSSVKIETLEKTFDTIMKGIDETRQIEAENKQNREESKKRLASLQDKIKQSNLKFD